MQILLLLLQRVTDATMPFAGWRPTFIHQTPLVPNFYTPDSTPFPWFLVLRVFASRYRPSAPSLSNSPRDGKEPSFIGFGSVRVLVNFFKWRVLVLFGSFKNEGSSSVRSVRVRFYSHL